MSRLEHENDVDVLRQATKILDRENQKLTQKVVELTRENLALKGQDPETLQQRIANLEQQLAMARQRQFGDSSEKRSGVSEKGTKEKQTGHGPREQQELPVVDTVHELDHADKICTSCGGALEVMKGQTEESEEVDVLERRFVLRRHKRLKYRCRCGGCIETALLPPKLFDGARYSIDFAIEIAASKYLDHLPLERQVRIMKREGLVVDSQTLWDQIERLARLLRAAYQRVCAHVLAKTILGADETRWRLMGASGKDEGEASRWQVWTACADDAVFYSIEDSRSADAAEKIFENFEGVIVCDGYSAYSALQKRTKRFELAHCWAHVRRKFVECEDFFPERCRMILDMIGELYAVEADVPRGVDGDELRAKVRDERSREVIERIRKWAVEVPALSESALGKAIAYMTKIWFGLVRFLEDPRIPLDNNATERALRGVVVGRKNHYGSRSRRGTEVAALFYTLMESAKLAGVDPKAYLPAAVVAARENKPALTPLDLAT